MTSPMMEYTKKYFRRIQLSTARGRQIFMAENEPDEVRRTLSEAMQDQDFDEPTRATFKTLLDRLDVPDRPGVRGTLEDFQHGFVAGVAKTPAAVADLALTPIDLLNRAVGNPDNMARDMRGGLQEFNAKVGETFDARGTAGVVGEVGGGLVGGMLPYGAAANLTGKGIQAVAPASKIAKTIAAATGPGATLGQQVGANVATGAGINLAQAASLDDATMAERAKSFAIGTAADVLFPLAMSPKQTVAAAKSAVSKSVDALGAQLAPDSPRAQQIDVLSQQAKAAAEAKVAQRAEVETQRKLYKEDFTLAEELTKQEWIKQNPGGQWAELPKAERKAKAKEFVAAHPDYGWKSKSAQKLAGLDKPADATPVEPTAPQPVAAAQALPEPVATAPTPPPPPAGSPISLKEMQGEAPETGEIPGVFVENAVDELEGPTRRTNTNLYPSPKPIVEPKPPVAVDAPVVASFESPLRTIKLLQPLEDVVQLTGDAAKKAFKGMKTGIKYDEGESLLDNMKEAVWRKLEADPNNADAIADRDALETITKAMKAVETRPELRVDPASPAGVIEQTKLELQQNPPKVELPKIEQPAAVAPPPELDPKVARAWFKRDLNEFQPQELRAFYHWLDDKVTSMDMVTGKPYMDKMHQVMEVMGQRSIEPVLKPDSGTTEIYTDAEVKRRFQTQGTYDLDQPVSRHPRIKIASLRNGDLDFDSGTEAQLDLIASRIADSPWGKALYYALENAHRVIQQRLLSIYGPHEIASAQFKGFYVNPMTRAINHTNPMGGGDHYFNPLEVLGLVEPGFTDDLIADRLWGVIKHEWGHNTGAKDGTLEFEAWGDRLSGDIAETFNHAKQELRSAIALMRLRQRDVETVRMHYDMEHGNAYADYIRNGPSAGRVPNSRNAAASQSGGSISASANVNPEGLQGSARVPGSPDALAQARQPSTGPSAAAGAVRKGGSYINPTLRGGGAGMLYGVISTDKEDPNYWAKVAMWTAVGAGGSLAIRNVWSKSGTQKPKSLVPQLEHLSKRVRSVDDIEGKQLPLMSRLRAFYTELVRSTYEVEETYRALGIQDLPMQANGSKLMQTWGRHVGMTEAWLTDGPSWVDAQGNPQAILDDAGQPVKALNKILIESAQGHKDDLGVLMVARTSLELAARGRKAAYTPDEASQILHSMPEFLHKAADEMRQYHKALLRVLVQTGRISQQAFDTMTQEDWYAPLQRVMGGEKNTLAQAVKSRRVNTPKGIFERQAQGVEGLEVVNPYDVTVEMTARILRSAEFNNVVSTMYRNVQMFGKDVGDLFMRKGTGRGNLALQRIKAKAGILATELKISNKDAEGLLAYMDETMQVIEATDKRLLVSGYDEGKLVTYEVAPGIFEAYKAMRPLEMDTFLRIASPFARLPAQGIVQNPAFVMTQAFIDTFGAALTSRHGFRPVIDSFRGWLHVARNSPEYQALMKVGGPSTIQSLKFTGDLESAVRAVQVAGKNPWETAVHQFKEMHPWEAMKTVMLPWAEAARVGEYLRALDHGESVLEATYAAWNVMGNMKMQGAAQQMRALNLISMFLRPAISGIDETFYRTGLPHPRRGMDFDSGQAAKFLTMGMLGISLPSAMLWYANKDDDELNQLRRTESGGRYWWMRINGTPVKMRKPHIIGQVFGSVTEEVLDKMYAENPQGTNDWLGSMFDDALVNLLPTIGVIPYALANNKIPGLGAKLTPDKPGEAFVAGEDRASLPARFVADKLKPVSSADWAPEMLARWLSPAGLDLTARTLGGMWGEDALKAVTWAHEWVNEDAPPPAAQLPLVGRFFTQEQSSNLGTIRLFYSIADRIDKKATTVAKFSNDPERLISYMPGAIPYLAMAPEYNKARSEIAQLWRAVYDMRSIPDALVPPATKRKVEKAYVQQIARTAWAANLSGKILLEQ